MKPSTGENSLAAAGRSSGKLRILVAPLDWGLGHATRCIPIIRELLARNCEVILASDGPQRSLLEEEFPGLEFVSLPGYEVRYSSKGWLLPLKLLAQSPRVLRAIREEHKWLRSAIPSLRLNAVISDNRFGLYTDTVPSVFITHQLRIRSPLGKWHENIIQRKNYRYINRFATCWIPDAEEGHTLAGELAHPGLRPRIPAYYLGTLSRFGNNPGKAERSGHLLFLLSGPEPQRSILEEKIINDIVHYPGSATIVRGLPGSKGIIPSTNSIRFCNHLDSTSMEEEILSAEFVICRSGYSSIMDIAAMRKKSVFIPTPGQTEQEYLARHLCSARFAPFLPQNRFSLAQILKTARNFEYRQVAFSKDPLSKAINILISSPG